MIVTTGIGRRVMDLGGKLPWTCNQLDIADEAETDSQDGDVPLVRRKVTFKGKARRGII